MNHLESCPMLGRGKAPHNAVRDALMHMVGAMRHDGCGGGGDASDFC